MIPVDIVIRGDRTMKEKAYSEWRVTGRSGLKLCQFLMLMVMVLMIMYRVFFDYPLSLGSVLRTSTKWHTLKLILRILLLL